MHGVMTFCENFIYILDFILIIGAQEGRNKSCHFLIASWALDLYKV